MSVRVHAKGTGFFALGFSAGQDARLHGRQDANGGQFKELGIWISDLS
jgi:hypothetical protein